MISKYKIGIIALLLCLPNLVSAHAVDPDSLSAIRGKFAGCVKEAQQLCGKISSPDDYEANRVPLKLLGDKMDRLRNNYSDLLDDDKKVSEAVVRYEELRERIEDNVKKYQRQHTQDSLLDLLFEWQPRFDSLLAAGQVHVEHNEADSVREVKSKSDRWWAEVDGIRSTYLDYFKADDELSSQYSRIKSTQNNIQELPIKEKVKLRDILLVAGVIVGVLTMVIGMVGSRIREKKMLKKAGEVPPLEL